MAYNPPRVGTHKRKSDTRHTVEEDIAFFTKRRKELQEKRDAMPLRINRTASQELECKRLVSEINGLTRKIQALS